jgi:hypothetical protein
MADARTLVIKGTTSSVNTAGAAAASTDLNFGTEPNAYSHHRAVLLINNRNTGLEVRANIEAGDFERSCLGDLDVDIAASSYAAIPFTDSMRHLVKSTGKVTVNFRDTADTALTAGDYAGVEAILILG